MRFLSTLVLLFCFATTARAATYLDLGSFPNIGLTHEWSKVAVGLGLSASWQTLDQPVSPFGETEHVTIFVFQPTADFQFFLNQDPKVRSFLEARTQKWVPIVSHSTFSDSYKDATDDWTIAGGAGLRSALNERLHVGGAVDASFRLQTFGGKNNVIGSTFFRVYLQYEL